MRRIFGIALSLVVSVAAFGVVDTPASAAILNCNRWGAVYSGYIDDLYDTINVTYQFDQNGNPSMRCGRVTTMSPFLNCKSH